MNIRGIQKLTLVDFPGKVAAIFFTGSCNFRCPYCHNPCLVLDPESQPEFSREEFIEFLDKRRGRLEGVVFSGGEPTLQADLPEYAALAADRGYAVKVDTNGSNPEMIEKLYRNGTLSMLGVDFKAQFSRYNIVAGCKDPGLAAKVRRTITFAIANDIPLDVRTTVHKALLDVDDLKEMAKELEELGVKKWMLQQFRGEDILDTELAELPTFTDSELRAAAANICSFAMVRE